MTDHTPALQRPATRTARLSAIEQALLTRIVTSQSQLSQILADQGIEVTQATLSRDLDEIHATKTRLADGTVAYAVGKQNIDEHPASNAAQYVASVIDKQPIEGVLGTIAGDDTVMVICSEDDVAKRRAQWLLDVASKA